MLLLITGSVDDGRSQDAPMIHLRLHYMDDRGALDPAAEAQRPLNKVFAQVQTVMRGTRQSVSPAAKETNMLVAVLATPYSIS